MGYLKKKLMDDEEKLVESGFQDWEIDKLTATLSSEEIDRLCKRLNFKKGVTSENYATDTRASSSESNSQKIRRKDR